MGISVRVTLLVSSIVSPLAIRVEPLGVSQFKQKNQVSSYVNNSMLKAAMGNSFAACYCEIAITAGEHEGPPIFL